MLSLRSAQAAGCTRPARTKRVVVRAGKKNDLEEAWLAQQDLLAERRRKAAEQSIASSGGRYVPRARDTKAPPPTPARVPKSEPKLVVEDDEEEEVESANPLGGFIGKLFGRK